MIEDWMNSVILSAACFAQNNIDPDTACFLKCEDAGHIMKSECVSDKAPQALSWDWRMK